MKRVIIAVLIAVVIVCIGLDSDDLTALLLTKAVALATGYLTYRLMHLWRIEPEEDE